MSVITFRLDKNSEKKLEEKLQTHRYTTKTEFIREAIRDKIKNLEKDELIMKMYGTSKRKTTNKQLHKAGSEVIKELEKKFGIK